VVEDGAGTQLPTDLVWEVLGRVPDPEIPVISIVDLGIVRNVAWEDGTGASKLVVTVTPTYSGCPATEVISQSIVEALAEHGLNQVEMRRQLSPAWTTDWLSDRGREKLRAYGIAPPGERSNEHIIDASLILKRPPALAVTCPNCGSSHTRLVSQFGSTPCKALYSCTGCLEPFDYFKPH
jgi:ring-1,2-phenylacetyl-CoA epoxidase subunit PaaD